MTCALSILAMYVQMLDVHISKKSKISRKKSDFSLLSIFFDIFAKITTFSNPDNQWQFNQSIEKVLTQRRGQHSTNNNITVQDRGRALAKN